MIFRRTPLIILLTLLSLLGVTVAQAQGDCPVPIPPPPENICADMGADQACYISGDVTVFAREAEAEFNFSTPGDRLDIADLEAIELEGGAAVLIHRAPT